MPDSQSLCFLAIERGRVDLRCVPVEGGSMDVLLTADREMQAYDLSPDGKQVGFVASTDQAPSDLYAAALDTSMSAGSPRLTLTGSPQRPWGGQRPLV